MPRSERDIVIGKVIAPFGVRGELKALVLTDFPERFDRGNRITLSLPGGERRQVRIESSRPHRGGIVLRIEGVDDLGAAKQLRNAEVVIDEAELGKLADDRFYVFDVIGLKVVTDDGREQGEVTEVMQGGANDVYVTSTGLCIPALKNVVTKIDLENGVMVIHPVPGLLPEE